MNGKEFDFKLRKVSFHGITWDCPRPWNFKKRDWSG